MVVTRQEALELENKIDKLLSKALGYETYVSMALTGRLKVNYCGGYLSLNREDFSINYINYHGYYESLLEEHKIIKNVIHDNKADIDLLIESYCHEGKLI